jgi:hypothetical protein
MALLDGASPSSLRCQQTRRLDNRYSIIVFHTSRKKFLPQLARRFCAGLVLFSFVVTTTGVPLPIGSGKDLSKPFPCQNRPCCCRSAEECWQHCCCFSKEEHLNWARSHGIEPPPYFYHSDNEGCNVACQGNRTDEDCRSTCGCSRCKESSHGDTLTGPKSTVCCHAEPKDSQSAKNSQPKAGFCWALGVSALQCRGLSTLWITTGAVFPSPPPVQWSPTLCSTEWLTFSDPLAISLPTFPPDPPPRQSAAC